MPYILIIKPARCTNFSNLFWNKTLHVSNNYSVHHQEFSTIHTAVVFVLQVCWQLASCQQTYMTYTIAVCAVLISWWWTEELSETCKVLFQNKFDKLVHLYGFIVTICHDSRSPERQIFAICWDKKYTKVIYCVYF